MQFARALGAMATPRLSSELYSFKTNGREPGIKGRISYLLGGIANGMLLKSAGAFDYEGTNHRKVRD